MMRRAFAFGVFTGRPLKSNETYGRKATCYLNEVLTKVSGTVVMSADTSTPLFAALAAMAFTFAMSELPFDFNRSRAFGGSPHVTLKTHLFEDRQSIADLLGEGIKLGHHPACRIRKVRERKVGHRWQ